MVIRKEKLKNWLDTFDNKDNVTTKRILNECFVTDYSREKTVTIGRIMKNLGYIRVKPKWPLLPYYVKECSW